MRDADRADLVAEQQRADLALLQAMHADLAVMIASAQRENEMLSALLAELGDA